VNQHFRNRQFPAGNPLANVLVVIVGIIVISLSLALGFVVFIGIAGFMLVMAAIISVRAWWLKRRFGAQKGGGQVNSTSRREIHRVIEGEYHEVRQRNSGSEDSQDL
jgi:tellurite resistance protein TehA-like permease